MTDAAPYNLAPNSQWEIWSGVSYGDRWKADGSGLMATASLLGNSVTNVVELALNAIPAGTKVGDLVKITGYSRGGVPVTDDAIGTFPMAITTVDPANNFLYAQAPRGMKPINTGTGTVHIVNIGGTGSVGTGDSADYWKKTPATQAWREDNAVNLAHGALYAIGLAKSAGTNETLYVPLEVARYRGRTMVFGCWIRQRVKAGSGTFRIWLSSDGTGGTTTFSTLGTGSGAYEYLEVTATYPADATHCEFGINLEGAANDVYYVVNPMFTAGTALGSNAYSKPRERLIPIVKVEPRPWIDGTVTFPSTPSGDGIDYRIAVDMHADSNGAIARSVRLADGCIEGINDNAVRTGIAGSRLIGWGDNRADPLKLGNFMSQQVQSVKTHQPLRLPMIDGKCVAFSGTAGDTWSNISIDLDAFNLE